MTDTPEAVRLAGLLEQWARDYAGTTYEEDALTQSAALLRRIPELETARDVAVELAAKYAAERDQLRAWQQAAFAAHPNIDIDIEAITPPNADQKGQ